MAAKKAPEENQPPNVGQLLRTHIKTKRLFRSALARKLNRSYVTVQGYEKKASLHVSVLWELSMAMKHNFLLDIASQLPKEFSTYAPQDTTAEDRIRDLETENEHLKSQVDLLKEVLAMRPV